MPLQIQDDNVKGSEEKIHWILEMVQLIHWVKIKFKLNLTQTHNLLWTF